MASDLSVLADAGLPAAVMEQLRQGAHHARGTKAPETIRAMRRSFEAFGRWCAAEGQPSLPASPATVTRYVDHLNDSSGRKAAGIKQTVWAIGAVHRLGSMLDPTKAEPVRQALVRMARQLGTRQQQAAPVNSYEARRIRETAGIRTIDLRDVALLLLMRDLLARRSEAVALDVADIAYDQDGSGLATIRRSKTDQTGEGRTLYLSPPAVQALQRWIEAGRIAEGPLFRSVSKAGVLGERLQAAEVARIIKRLARKAGLPEATIERLSGHSCRVGMAQDLVAAGADVAGLMQAGRWKSMQMPARYSEKLDAKRGVVAQLQDKLTRLTG